MDITFFAASTPTVLEAEELGVQKQEDKEGGGRDDRRDEAKEVGLRDDPQGPRELVGMEGNEAIDGLTPVNQSKRLRPATGSSGNSEEQIRKAADRSALESRRSRGGSLPQSTVPMGDLEDESEIHPEGEVCHLEYYPTAIC